MSRTKSWREELVVWCLLVALGALTRLTLRDLPNFAPVAALSLFAGYYFTSYRWALLVAPAIMLASDAVIGFYRAELMATVYGMLTLPVVARPWLQRYFRFENRGAMAAWGSFLGLVGCSLLASCAFFVATNFMCWWGVRGYSQDLAGLTRCYWQALPFFRNTLLGDAFYSLLCFGTYGLLLRAGWTHSALTPREWAVVKSRS